MELSNQQISTIMDALSDAMQYARDHQDDKEYKLKKDDYYKLYCELSNFNRKET